MAVAPSTDAVLHRFLEELDLAHLLEDERFATYVARRRNRAAINAAVNGAMRERTVDEWIDRLNAVGVPCGRVQTVGDALRDPQVAAQDMVIEVPTERTPARTVGFPLKMDATPCGLSRGVPALDADREAILAELGIDGNAERGIG